VVTVFLTFSSNAMIAISKIEMVATPNVLLKKVISVPMMAQSLSVRNVVEMEST